MPFGLCNAPSVFQRLMNQLLTTFSDLAAVYLDDILIYSETPANNISKLEKLLQLLETEGLTLNPRKCRFLFTSFHYLGYEVSQEGIRPGEEKCRAINNFPQPGDVHQIRQFMGLTGYFRQFVPNYATVGEPLTRLTKKSQAWVWNAEQQKSFETLKGVLVNRPILRIYDTTAKTEVHTDSSARGLGGILMQYFDGHLHPVSYYSRQTTTAEKNYHSYELETLAVVETLKKYRIYLIDKEFVLVTDCNALKTAWTKRDLLPRMARWWLMLQEYNFMIEFRPGNKMRHVDALSRNPDFSSEPSEEVAVLKIEAADWVLSAQLTDDKIVHIRSVLEKPPVTDYEKGIYKNYALRDHRLYRITVRGLQWVVPKGMRQHVRAAHDEMGHFAVEKTLDVLCNHYWFPKMKEYVQKYKCCIPCIYTKSATGRRPGYLHPIPKVPVPFHTIHIDHLGPFNRSRRRNMFLIVVVDAFTKFVLLKPVRTTKSRPVLKFLDEVCFTYGAPNRIIADRGTAYTFKKFGGFCNVKGIQLIKNAVAIPRPNGQVERYNRTIIAGLTAQEDEHNWDTYVPKLQFALNNTVHKDTRKTPSEVLMGYRPRNQSDTPLVNTITCGRTQLDLLQVRNEVAGKIKRAQEANKRRFDNKRKPSERYKIGDLIVVEKCGRSDGASAKLKPKFCGPMVVKDILPNDRYRVVDMPCSNRRVKGRYDNIVAVDRMKRWVTPGGLSDESEGEYNDDEDGVPLQEESSASD